MKYSAPKAVLVSDIIQGLLGGTLPWGLVLFGIMISVVLELSGIPSLAFAVGVYLPISSSTPLLAGGMVRWLVDRRQRHALREAGLSEAQLNAESDKSPGVLLASGYIAGGAIAGIVIAFMAGVLTSQDTAITHWAEASQSVLCRRAFGFAGVNSLCAAGGFAVLGRARAVSKP